MTRVDFAHGAADRLKTACQVVYRHYLAGHAVVVYTADTQRLARFDQLLWAFEPTAFVPHVREDDALASQTPVVLVTSAPARFLQAADTTQRWLLNLDAACPPDAQQFARILEIVSQREADRHEARARWLAYRDAGFELRAHQLNATHTD